MLDNEKSKKSSDKFLLTVFIFCIFICLTYIITYDIPEILVFGFIHGGVIFDFVSQIAIGFIVSYIFYMMIKLLFERKEKREKRELLEFTYKIIIKRLTEYTSEIEKKYSFSWVKLDSGSGFDYASKLFSAFELNEEGLNGLKQLLNKMQTTNYKDYCMQFMKDEELLNSSFSIMAVDFYESGLIKSIVNEIINIHIPQVLLIEPDNDIKKKVYELLENITDARDKVKGEIDTNYGKTFPHLTRSVEHIIDLYELLLSKRVCSSPHYQS